MWLGGRNASHHTANLNCLLLLFCVYLFKNCPLKFFSHQESAEPVFCSKELSSHPCKNQNKSLTLSYLLGKFKFTVCSTPAFTKDWPSFPVWSPPWLHASSVKKNLTKEFYRSCNVLFQLGAFSSVFYILKHLIYKKKFTVYTN